jgi:hypothetical protein
MHDLKSRAVRIAVALLLLGALAPLGGCFTVSKRALMNGTGLSTNSGQAVVYGQHNFAAQRQQFGRLDYLRHGRYQEVPYPYFGHW